MVGTSWELQESKQEVVEARTGEGWRRAREAGPHRRGAADGAVRAASGESQT